MKRWRFLIKLVVLVCAVIAVTCAVPSSLAYITVNSNTVENSFRMVAQPPKDAIVPIAIHKSMLNFSNEEIGPGGFRFQLLDLETNGVAEAVSMDNGYAFMHLSFSHQDIGKTFSYWLYELNDSRENVTYDETVYSITIEIGLNDKNEITADCAVDGKKAPEIAVEFENTYFVPVTPPDTGDEDQPAVWLAMMIVSGAGLIACMRKRPILGRVQ